MQRCVRLILGWLSVAGALALGVLWVRGARLGDAVFATFGHACAPGADPRAPSWATWTIDTYGVSSARGVLCFYRGCETFFDYSVDAFDGNKRTELHHNFGVPVELWTSDAQTVVPWFSFTCSTTSRTDFAASLAVPDWALLSPLTAIGWVLLRNRRARRERRGLCPACAYDVKGNSATGCPECGWNRQPAPRRAGP